MPDQTITVKAAVYQYGDGSYEKRGGGKTRDLQEALVSRLNLNPNSTGWFPGATTVPVLIERIDG